jgi:hypothetical protein
LIPREAGSRSIAAARSKGGGIDSSRKRTMMVSSEGGVVKVDGSRKRTTMARSEGGRVEVDSLRKRTVMARSEAEIEAAMCSEAGDEAVACSRVEIEDSRQR